MSHAAIAASSVRSIPCSYSNAQALISFSSRQHHHHTLQKSHAQNQALISAQKVRNFPPRHHHKPLIINYLSPKFQKSKMRKNPNHSPHPSSTSQQHIARIFGNLHPVSNSNGGAPAPYGEGRALIFITFTDCLCHAMLQY